MKPSQTIVMAAKRKSSQQDSAEDAERVPKKVKKGFTVGPANLPDGTYRRKGWRIFCLDFMSLTFFRSAKDQGYFDTQG